MLIKLWWMEGRLKAGSVSRGKLFISLEFFLSFGFLQTRLVWLALPCVGLFLSVVELCPAGFHLLVKLFDDDVSTWSPRVIAFCSVSTRCCRGLQRLGIDLLIGPLFPHDFSRYENSLVCLSSQDFVVTCKKHSGRVKNSGLPTGFFCLWEYFGSITNHINVHSST